MFNADKLLGGIVQEALGSSLGRPSRRRRSRSGSLERAVGMGLVGLAVAAFEHFTQQSQPAQAGVSRPAPPPPPPVSSVPPPPPGADVDTAPSVLLLRAMFAAAAADGMIDEAERSRIFERVAQGGVTPEEKAFLDRELASPCSLFQLLEEVERSRADAALREQVYFVSRVAVEVDTDAEREYLSGLAEGLGLSEAQRKNVDEQIG